MDELTDRGKVFRSAIAAFIETRREAKLKGDDDNADAVSKYEYGTWLAEAARRASAIQLVTHPLKATYPDAKIRETTSPFVQGRALPDREEIGSHSIKQDILDGTGDAASLGAFNFLTKVVVQGRPLIDWVLEDDPDLLAALNSTGATAADLVAEFKKLLRTAQAPASHTGAKQLYWLVGNTPADDSQYHLLQPMFSSSLAHAVHADIQEARFGEANKLARQARRSKEAHESTYRDYRNLVVRKLGGTKPQNISQLNSERGGINYLLASLPPTWTLDRPHSLLNLESAMERLVYFKPVRRLVDALAEFLLSNPPANDKTRQTRRSIEQELGAQLSVFAAETRARFEPGWTRDLECTLPPCEKQWLDPERAELPPRIDPEHPEWAQQDHEFEATHTFGDWPDEVAGRFANWINARLRARGLTAVGDAEYKHWAKQAIVDAEWPVPQQRRAPSGATA